MKAIGNLVKARSMLKVVIFLRQFLEILKGRSNSQCRPEPVAWPISAAETLGEQRGGLSRGELRVLYPRKVRLQSPPKGGPVQMGCT